MTHSIKHDIIWLTGASSGIGEALVHALQGCCGHLIISARGQDTLEQLANNYDNVIPMAVDITDEPALLAVAATIQERFGRIDTLIANAGTCEYVDVKQFDTALIKRVNDTNYMGFVYTVGAALPLLRNSNHPHLVGMSSTVAYVGLTRAQAYGASKAAIYHFLESLKVDLTQEHMDVSVICPGFVKTPLTDQNDFPMPMRISAQRATQYIIKGLEKRPFEIHFPKRFSYLLKLISLLPERLRFKLTTSMANHS